MVKIYDNIINEFEQEIVKKYLYDESKWSFIQDVSLENNLHQRRPGFKIMFDDVHPLSSYFETIINNTAKKIKLKNPELLEARSFLQLPLNKEYVGEGVDTPHLDRTEPHLVFLYYVNDSDGPTLLFDDDGNIIESCHPKKGRCIIFPGETMHSSAEPKHHPSRIVITYNILL